MARQVFQVLLLLLGALALHYGLGRLARRIPFWWAYRRSRQAPAAALQRCVALAGTSVQAALWLATIAWASALHPALEKARTSGALALMRAVRAPLFTSGERGYSLVDLALPPLLLVAVWLATSAVVRGVRAVALEPAGLDTGLQDMLSMLLRYALVIPAALVLLQIWGVDLRALAILASVLGLGIGFGLQNIANNFVSGLVLNLERPIRPGDYVHVGASAGTVERIGVRSTLIRTVDQVAILVPNSQLLESEVINWSHGDPLSRLHVPVGVAYGSNPARVRQVLLQVAHGDSAVVREPRPRVELRGFGESSLDFELLVWTRDPRNQRALVSDLNYRICSALREAGIQIPFPQRDLHLRSPALERWLGARSEAPSDEEMPELQSAGPERDPDRAASEWSAAELESLVERLRAPGGISIRERRYRLRSYPRAFIGSEAVSWLVEHEDLTREGALELGRRLVTEGLLHHVLDEHDFRDGHFFYRFRTDEAEAAVPPSYGRVTSPRPAASEG